jgi:outer membrane lipoprotein SlyB
MTDTKNKIAHHSKAKGAVVGGAIGGVLAGKKGAAAGAAIGAEKQHKKNKLERSK